MIWGGKGTASSRPAHARIYNKRPKKEKAHFTDDPTEKGEAMNRLIGSQTPIKGGGGGGGAERKKRKREKILFPLFRSEEKIETLNILQRHIKKKESWHASALRERIKGGPYP